jgi:hypothetical protein
VSEEPEIIGVDMAAGKDHSVVLIRSNRDFGRREVKELVSKYPEGTLFIFMRPAESIASLSDDDMNQIGWYRKENAQ